MSLHRQPCSLLPTRADSSLESTGRWMVAQFPRLWLILSPILVQLLHQLFFVDERANMVHTGITTGDDATLMLIAGSVSN